VIFNLGALYSQLASSEDRSNQEGLKRAIGHYQVSLAFLAYSTIFLTAPRVRQGHSTSSYHPLSRILNLLLMMKTYHWILLKPLSKVSSYSCLLKLKNVSGKRQSWVRFKSNLHTYECLLHKFRSSQEWIDRKTRCKGSFNHILIY